MGRPKKEPQVIEEVVLPQEEGVAAAPAPVVKEVLERSGEFVLWQEGEQLVIKTRLGQVVARPASRHVANVLLQGWSRRV